MECMQKCQKRPKMSGQGAKETYQTYTKRIRFGRSLLRLGSDILGLFYTC